MTLKKVTLLGSIALALITSYPQNVRADIFKNSDFLEMQEERQKFWLTGALETLVHVAAFKNKDLGQCVNDWYFSEKMAERNWLIMESIKKYPDHTPSAILVALTQRACGEYLNAE